MTKDESVLQELMRVRVERNDYRETLIRVSNHAHGMPPSRGTGYIISEVNKVLELHND